jgi:hypothetical protein
MAMMRKAVLVILAAGALVSTAAAQTAPWRFRWQKGQVHTYRVEQQITVTDEVGQTKTGSQSKLNLLKRWQVADVDAAGTATLQLSLAALRMETTTPGGETLLFDSANLDKSSPALREQMQRYVGQPLAVLRVDARGQVLDVKDAKFGPASRYVNELPFALVLPDKGAAPGQAWERPYQIVLDPPHGTGEKYDAVQKYSCTKQAGSLATITVTTALKKKPDSAADEMPLLQFQPQGEIVFDTQAGLLRSARLSIDKEVTGHQGEGSRYHFQSTYVEECAGSK